MEIPVFLFTGFLESGKTTFIQETLEDPRFNTGEKILLLMCEEGFTEINLSKPELENIACEIVDKEDFVAANLKMLATQHKAERVLIEYNGMWEMSFLYENLPKNWMVYQQINFFEAGNALTYNSNMRNLVADKLTNCELVVFNRMDENADEMAFHKLVRGLNRGCEIIYEYKDGSIKIDEIEDPLPFDIEADIIEIEDKDYAIWYANLLEHTDNYIGKKIRFKGLVAVDKAMGDKAFVIGRHVMTCCVDDIEYKGIACFADEKVFVNNRDWKFITAEVQFGFNDMYEGEGPMLQVISLKNAEKPEDEVATFY